MKMKIGSHVSMSAPAYLEGAVKEALSYNATALMIYTGAPQNTRRKDISEMRVEEARALMSENGIDINDVIIHAPYIINLANTQKPETFELATEFLSQELRRVEEIGASILVLHPGSHVSAGEQVGLDRIVEGLDIVLKEPTTVKIALETMAGKGSELGVSFEQIRYIMDHVEHPEYLYVCMDTCHIHDAGYNVSDFDAILDEFDEIIGLDKLVVMHINDSKNPQEAHKDRHENIGYGHIGFDSLNYIVNHPRVAHLVKILETPYVDGVAPYKKEIEMLKDQTFDDWKQNKEEQ